MFYLLDDFIVVCDLLIYDLWSNFFRMFVFLLICKSF